MKLRRDRGRAKGTWPVKEPVPTVCGTHLGNQGSAYQDSLRFWLPGLIVLPHWWSLVSTMAWVLTLIDSGGRWDMSQDGRELFCRAEMLTFSSHTAETRCPSCTQNKNIPTAPYSFVLPLL